MVAVMRNTSAASEALEWERFDRDWLEGEWFDVDDDPFGDPRAFVAEPWSPGLPTRRTGPAHLRLVAAPTAPSPRSRPAARRTPPPSRSNRATAAVYRRRRLAAAAVLVGGIVAAALAGQVLGGASLAASEHPPRAVEYVVHPGDTVWSIARSFQPSGDPRRLVDELVAQHGGTDLQVGDVLRVPVG